MLSVRHRFHGYGSLKPVYQGGQTVRGSLMNLKYNPRRSGRGFRAAVVVSKKVHRSAVVRNRIRRRVYEIIRRSDRQLVEGKDMVITVFSDRTAEMDATKLRSLVEELLVKANGNSTRAAQRR